VQRNRRNWIAALTCLAVLLLILFSVGSSDDLLTRATRLALTQEVITNEMTYSGYHFFYHYAPSYTWLSDTDLYYIQETSRGNYETVRLDLAAGNIVKQAGRGPLRKTQGTLDQTFYWRVSPDGKWILIVSKNRDDLVYTATTLDGDRQTAWTNRFEGSVEPVWLSDSSGFVEWPARGGTNYARIRWLSSGLVKAFDLGASPTMSLQNLDRLKVPHATLSPKMLSSGHAAEFFELSGSGERLTLRRYSVSVPEELHQGESKVFLSPQGDRLAWLCFFKRKIPELIRVQRFPFFITEPQFTTAVLVSRLDGSELRLIGRLRPGDDIRNVAWTPSGRQLSFIHGNSLWTVPVD
jgi:hypothetical protein